MPFLHKQAIKKHKSRPAFRQSGLSGLGMLSVGGHHPLFRHALDDCLLCEPFKRIHGIKQTMYAKLVAVWQLFQ